MTASILAMQEVLLGLSLIDLAVVAGVAFVLPVCIGGRQWWWALVAGCIAISCTLDPGTPGAVALAATWPILGIVVFAGGTLQAGSVRSWTRTDVVHAVACAYSLVAAGGMVLSRMAATPFGIYEPIVELAAVHFIYAGPAALVLANAALSSAHTPGSRRLGLAAVTITGGAPVVVATGFLTGSAGPQVGGAVLMGIGVFATAALQLREAAREPLDLGTRALLTVSGLAVWAPMVLAVAWAVDQHWNVPALSVPDMVQAHGAPNALGFVGAGLLARYNHFSRRARFCLT